MTGNWFDAERRQAAEQRLLTVAEELFTEHGVDQTIMADIASAASCSRATLYRYFPTRNDIIGAYIRTTTERIFTEITEKSATVTPPHEQVTAAVALALDAIRGNPALGPWFEPDAGLPAKLAVSNSAIRGALQDFLTRNAPNLPETDLSATARWLTRSIIALIVMPEPTAEDEYVAISRFITPVLLPPELDRVRNA